MTAKKQDLFKKKDAVLVALYEASGGDLGAKFNERDIAVTSWKRFPDMFGISGYKMYPDTKEISKLLLKKSGYGLEWLGYLIRVRKGWWRLTESGIELAQRAILEGRDKK